MLRLPRPNPFGQPFPARPFGRSVVFGHGRTALFVLVALLFVYPVTTALAYAGVVFFTAVTYTFLTEQAGIHRAGPNWTLWRWTLDQACLLFLVSTACFLLYNAYRDWTLLSAKVLLFITIPTVLVGLIPIVLSGIAVQLHAQEQA